MTEHLNLMEITNMSKLDRVKYFALGGVYSLTAYTVGLYTAQLF